jgi:hypothetical protein
MSMHGDGSGCDLVKQIQHGNDLQTDWIMFDHVKHMEGWMTLACHVYDLFYILQGDDDCNMWHII